MTVTESVELSIEFTKRILWNFRITGENSFVYKDHKIITSYIDHLKFTSDDIIIKLCVHFA